MSASDRARVLDRLDVSRETIERLDIYADLLRRWSPKINLVAKSTLEALWSRHFLDSAQVFELGHGDAWADLGSGGGFPGLVITLLAAEKQPGLRMTMVEADQRKATFLRTVLRETGVGAEVICARIERVPPLGVDTLTARALAPLGQLLEHADRHLAPEGRALFLKGKNVQAEIEDALARWRFDCQTYASQTDAEAVILSIGDLSHV